MASLKAFPTTKVLATVVTILIISFSTLAHHGNAAYDDSRAVTVKGTVSAWIWANPHIIMHVDAPDETGKVVTWTFETENPTSMFNIGWSKSSIKVGDQVSVTAIVAKNGNPIGRIIDIGLPNGQKLVGKARAKDSGDSNK